MILESARAKEQHWIPGARSVRALARSYSECGIGGEKEKREIGSPELRAMERAEAGASMVVARTMTLRNREDDFAEVLSALQVIVGSGAFVERPNAIDNGFEASLGNQLEHGAQLVFCAHIGAQNGELSAKQETKVEFGVIAGRGAAGYQATARSKALDTVIPRGDADMLDDHIDAAVMGEPAHLFADRHDAVMDHFIGPKLPGLGEFFVIASGSEHTSAEKFRDLDGRAANTAAGRKNEDVLPGLQLRPMHQHVPGGEENERDGSSVGPLQILRIGHAVHLRASNVLGAATIQHVAEVGEVAAAVVVAGNASGTFAAGDARSKDNFFADEHGGYFRPDLDDFAGDVAAGNVRQRNGNAGKAAAHPEVQMIEGAGVDAHQDFVIPGVGFGHFGVMKNSGVAVAVEDNRFHEQPPGRNGSASGSMC